MSKQQAGIIGILIFASALLLIYMRTNPHQEPTMAQHADEKLAPRGSTVAQNPSPQSEKPLQDKSVGGPVPTPAGCHVYANMIYQQTGNTVTYTVSVSSIGTETCNNVSYSVYYPEGEQYKSAAPKPSASDYYWVLGDMRPNETRITNITTTKSNTDGTEMCATADNAKADACSTAVSSTSITQQAAPIQKPASTPTISTTKENSRLLTTSADNEFGVWVWDSPLSMSGQKMDSVITQTKNAGMNVIYITVDDVLTEDGAQFAKALAAFVRKANAQGIAVDAVAGARDWAKPANRSKGYAVIDFLKKYNKTNPKIRAFQYDVEPYLLPEYESNKAPVLADFVAFIDMSTLRLAGSGIRFSVVIPHFYDSTQAWTPKVTFNGKTDFAYNHVLRSLDRNPGSTVVVMAYRNYFEGEGGTREIVTPEIQQAGTTKVIVAQETGNVEPSYVTFYGQSQSKLLSALGSIQNAFKDHAGFGGVAVHYFDPFIELE